MDWKTNKTWSFTTDDLRNTDLDLAVFISQCFCLHWKHKTLHSNKVKTLPTSLKQRKPTSQPNNNRRSCGTGSVFLPGNKELMASSGYPPGDGQVPLPRCHHLPGPLWASESAPQTNYSSSPSMFVSSSPTTTTAN